MIIRRNLDLLAIDGETPILEALARISANKHRAVCCVTAQGHFLGILTDGDFRRWITSEADYDLRAPVRSICNRAAVTASVALTPEQIALRLVPPVEMLPILDAEQRLVAIALAEDHEVSFAGIPVGAAHPVVTVAEIGINHNGRVDRAVELVDAAVGAGADIVKFQLRSRTQLYRYGGSSDHREDLGAQYTMDLVERFSLPADELFGVFDLCRSKGVVPLCTAWDEPSVDELEAYGIDGYKIASADLTNHGLLERVARTQKPLIVSTGMSSEGEIREAVELLRREGAAFVMLHCNSTYPTPLKDINLRYLERLAGLTGGPVGYSGHERGWVAVLGAVALGAKIVEKHLTFDRSLEGADHKVSLLPDEFKAMVGAIRDLEEAMGAEAPRKPSQGELMNRVTLAKSLVAARSMESGETVAPPDVLVRSPGRGLQPNRVKQLVGKVLHRSVDSGDFFYPSDLAVAGPTVRAYRFRRPWGLPVRYHDASTLRTGTNPDFLEFHLSYRDLDEDPAAHLPGQSDIGLVVHSPDQFAGDHLLNLASDDAELRRRSEDHLAQVVDIVRTLRPMFRGDGPTPLIVSPGGFSQDSPMAHAQRRDAYDRVSESFDRVAHPDVELLAQTLPPFPWYRGGQLFCNLFVDPEDTVEFCERSGYRICLDVSHTKLAANHRRRSFAEVIEQLAPRAGHLHLVDAAGVDGEGLQVGEGEIDWPVLAEQLDRLAPGIGFIPEIWMGHADDGAGFWLANERLESWF